MKKLLVLLILLIALLVGGAVGYRALVDKNEPSYIFEKPVVIGETSTGDSAPVSPESQDSQPMPDADKAPDFVVYDADGNEVRLSDFEGRPVIINFWATWCGPCRAEFPAYEDAFSDFGNDAVFMMINLTDGRNDTVEGVTAFVNDNGYSFPVYFDTNLEASVIYGAYSIPLSVFIDENGILVDRHTGTMDKNTLYGYIESLIY